LKLVLASPPRSVSEAATRYLKRRGVLADEALEREVKRSFELAPEIASATKLALVPRDAHARPAFRGFRRACPFALVAFARLGCTSRFCCSTNRALFFVLPPVQAILTPALGFCHATLRGKKPLKAKYPETLVTIGDHLRKRRIDRGLSRPLAAKEIGVHFTTLQGWEENRRNPAPRHVPSVVRFLGYIPFASDGSPGDRLRTERRLFGLTQPEYAAMLGVHTATLERWENGESPAALEAAARCTPIRYGARRICVQQDHENGM
jgi:transcriptional regulator with XRE-family HTH domain